MTDPKALIERVNYLHEGAASYDSLISQGLSNTAQLHLQIPALLALITSQQAEIARLTKAIKAQAGAVRSLEANKETEINRLRAKSTEAHHAVSTLDSEREANAILTEQAEAAEAEIARLREALAGCLPRNVCLTNRNVPDSMIVPLEVTMGELRKVAALSQEPK